MTLLLARFLVLCLCLMSPLVLFSQPAPSQPVPSDPATLMSLAREKNGLNSSDVQPWHIRGTYTLFDIDGKPQNSGVYEEWWFSEQKYKRSYTSAQFKQVDYATGTALYREGSQDWPGFYEVSLRSDLIEPLPEDSTLKEFKLEQHTESVGKGKINCVTLRYPMPSNLVLSKDFFPGFCFESSIPALRLALQTAGTQTVYESIVAFQGHYLASELRTSVNGKPRIALKLDLFERLKDSPDAILAPPPNALPVNLAMVSLKSGAAFGWQLKTSNVHYPEGARGTVVIRATVGKNGHVTNAQAISGPSLLNQAALDSVRQYVYRPFRVMGEPVMFNFQLVMNANMRH
jgi:Gram-negative bacterial TonB protein C-terminal